MTKRSLNNQQAMNKKERLVAAIKNGTVIDHIPVEKTFDVVNLLQLQHLSTPVTIGYNLSSKMVGTKGIIKVSDKFFTDDEISRLSVVAPNVVLNIIKDYEVVEKKKVDARRAAGHRQVQQSEVYHQQRTDGHHLQRDRQGARNTEMSLLRQRTKNG